MSTNFQTNNLDAKSAAFLLRVIFPATSCQTAASSSTTRTSSTAMAVIRLQRLQKGRLVPRAIPYTFVH